jgi:hypothetical protein
LITILKGVETVATRRTNAPKGKTTRRPPATTPEGRENQLIAKAVDLAEKQLEDGSASAQVITHYLKLGSSREKLEQERLAEEVELAKAKREAMAAQQRVEELYVEAITAMRRYAGQEPLHDDGDVDD